MTLFRTIAPSIEPVTIVEAKTHLRVEHDGEDELIGLLIRAAREEVEAQTGLALLAQGWRLTLDAWPRDGVVLIRKHPVTEISEVTVYGPGGDPETLPGSAWHFDPRSRPARLALSDTSMALRRLNGIEIDFIAGFGESGPDVPDSLRRAVLLLVAHWYEFRAAFDAARQPVSIPSGFSRLVASWRSGRLT